MKIVTILFLLLSIGVPEQALCQGDQFEFSDIQTWPSVSPIYRISDDGKAICYSVQTENGLKIESFLKLTKSNNQISINIKGSILDGGFVDGSKYFVFLNHGDSLCIISPSHNASHYISNIQSFKLISANGSEQLVYKTNVPNEELYYYNLNDHKSVLVSNSSASDFFVSRTAVIYQTKFDTSTRLCKLFLFDIERKSTREILSAQAISKILISDDGNRVICNVKKDTVTEISCYTISTMLNKVIVSDTMKWFGNVFKIGSLIEFDNSTGDVVFNISQAVTKFKANNSLAKVDIWNYKDIKLKSQRRLENKKESTYRALCNVNGGTLRRIEHDGERFVRRAGPWYLLFRSSNVDPGERKWNFADSGGYTLFNEVNHERVNFSRHASCEMSPNGKYIIIFDREIGYYRSYDIEQRIFRDLSKGLFEVDINNVDGFYDPNYSAPVGNICGWLANDDLVLIQDGFDIWKLSMNAKMPPLNLTNGYGKKTNTVFKVHKNKDISMLREGTDLILSAFNLVDKSSGFYKMNVAKQRNPTFLTMGPYVYNHSAIYMIGYNKAKNGRGYFMFRESEKEVPNLFYTEDFKTFKQLTFLSRPSEKSWLRNRLYNWVQNNGVKNQGILYYPEKFDSTKKYPVIVHYYEKMSHRLHEFIPPDFTWGNMNIPWFVSRGYLVFTPDIHYRVGEPGNSCLKSIVSATKVLTSLPYVDTARIGLQGHSFGGYETVFVIGNTNIFSAACAGSPPTDLISFYGGIYGNGTSMQSLLENTQFRIWKDLWSAKKEYIENSPIMHADKISTPLLLMANEQDPVVPASQGISLFTALRRLGKRVHLLQYDGESHSLVGEAAMKDYTIKMTDFFDFYLRGNGNPSWIVEGDL